MYSKVGTIWSLVYFTCTQIKTYRHEIGVTLRTTLNCYGFIVTSKKRRKKRIRGYFWDGAISKGLWLFCMWVIIIWVIKRECTPSRSMLTSSRPETSIVISMPIIARRNNYWIDFFPRLRYDIDGDGTHTIYKVKGGGSKHYASRPMVGREEQFGRRYELTPSHCLVPLCHWSHAFRDRNISINGQGKITFVV